MIHTIYIIYIIPHGNAVETLKKTFLQFVSISYVSVSTCISLFYMLHFIWQASGNNK